MNIRKSASPELPAKNQQVSITLKNGKTYTVVSQGQMEYILEMQAHKLTSQAVANKQQLTDEALKQKMIEFRDECPYAPLQWILDRMSPQEQDEWKAQYRFGGVNRSKK